MVNISSSNNVNVGVAQYSIIGPLLFLIYVKRMSNGVFPNCKLFADGFSLFSVVSDIQASIATLSYEPTVVSKWTFQWKKFSFSI